MNSLHIRIKDDDKAVIVLNLLRELPFVEIEEDTKKVARRLTVKGNSSFADLFGLWEHRNITLHEIVKDFKFIENIVLYQ